MYQELDGDLFESGAQVLVNAVNCRGVMGAGIALEFACRFPEMVERYKELCNKGMMKLGIPIMDHETSPWIMNFPTKDHWRENSKLWAIERGLALFREVYQEYDIESIAFPKLGCGLGGLRRESQVRPLMRDYLFDLDIDIWVYV